MYSSHLLTPPASGFLRRGPGIRCYKLGCSCQLRRFLLDCPGLFRALHSDARGGGLSYASQPRVSHRGWEDAPANPRVGRSEFALSCWNGWPAAYSSSRGLWPGLPRRVLCRESGRQTLELRAGEAPPWLHTPLVCVAQGQVTLTRGHKPMHGGTGLLASCIQVSSSGLFLVLRQWGERSKVRDHVSTWRNRPKQVKVYSCGLGMWSPVSPTRARAVPEPLVRTLPACLLLIPCGDSWVASLLGFRRAG